MKNPYDDAAALLDGGWNIEDMAEIAAMYELTCEEVNEIYEAMKKIMEGR